jgi:hypothetical protein
MKKLLLLNLIFLSCAPRHEVATNKLPEGEYYFDGHYSKNKVTSLANPGKAHFEFSIDGQCSYDSPPINAPDSPGGIYSATKYGRYWIKNDTLRARYYLSRTFIMKNKNEREFFYNDSLWYLSQMDTLKIDFLIRGKDTLIETTSFYASGALTLDNDSLSALPMKVGHLFKKNEFKQLPVE